MAISSNQPHPLAKKYPRTIGLAVLFIGLAIDYFCIVEPILHARIGGLIKLNGKFGLFGGIAIALGLVLVLFGRQVHEWGESSTAKSQKLALVTGTVFVLTYIVAIEFTKSYLRSKGYVLPR